MKRLMVYFLIVATALSMPARAEMIGTGQMLAQDARSTAVATVESFLARDQVTAQLEEWGVPPDAAADRVAALSDSELQQLAGRIDQQPAGGGALEIVLIILLILIILELVGEIDIFKKI